MSKRKPVATKQFTNDDSTAMARAVAKVYGSAAVVLESAVFNLARQFAPDSYDGGSWAFVTTEDGKSGFWYPTDKEAYDVTVPSNYYSNANMQAVAFGAGLSIVAVNMLAWSLHEKGQQEGANKFSQAYDQLRDFVFDLSENGDGFLDGSAVAGFID